MTISYDAFDQVDIRSGTIVDAKPFERARKPSFKIWADFGDEIGIKQTSAQITVHYSLDSFHLFGCYRSLSTLDHLIL